MRRADRSAREVLGAFSGAGAGVRLHTAGRWATCPFDQVEALVPVDGRILDLGCGHGHFSAYLAVRQPRRIVIGVDIDRRKIDIGRRAVAGAGLGDRVELLAVGDDWWPEAGAYDAVVAVDMLYLLGRERAALMLGAIVEAVRPGGRAVVKEMGERPPWKRAVNEVQERLATRVLRITAGSDLAVLREAEIEGPLRAAGLDVTRWPMDDGYTHPHLAFVGARQP